MSELSLHEIGLKYSTDKSTYHEYMDFYQKYLDRNKILKFLEIGVQSGLSIKTWREWLSSECVIEGWDIHQCEPIENCELKIVDQTNRQMIIDSIAGEYDVILDDGAHTPRSMETSFSVLFPYCKIYIIEDLHAWWLGYREGEEKSTFELLKQIENDGWLSTYSTNEESEYISRNAQLLEVFYRGDLNNPLSMSAVILNKRTSHA